MENMHLKCPSCGAELLADVKRKTARCYNCNRTYYLVDGPDGRYRVTSVMPEGFKNKKKKMSVKMKAFLITILVILILGITMAVVSYFAIRSAVKDDSYTKQGTTESARVEEEETKAPESSDYVLTERIMPESEGMQQAVTMIFQKPISEITEKDLQSIRYLSIDTTFDIHASSRIYVVRYSFEDYKNFESEEEFQRSVKEVKKPYDDYLRFDTADCSTMKNLTRLELDNEGLEPGDLQSLTQLTYLYVDDVMYDIIQGCNPEQIETLCCDYQLKNLEGIEAFTNLKELKLISCDELSSLEGIEQLPNLISLTLKDLDRLKKMDGVEQLTDLEELHIELDELKDISFVQKMPKLKTLTILGGAIIDYDDLTGNKTITSLTIGDNSKIKDYTPIMTLKQLEELDLDADYDGEGLDQIKQLKNLRELKFSVGGRRDDYSYFKTLKKLTDLTLEGVVTSGDLEFLKGMNLKSLTLVNVGGVEDASAIGTLKKLKQLTIRGNAYYGDMSGIFQNKNLEVLDLSKAKLRLDIGKLSGLKKLKELYLDEMVLYTRIAAKSEGVVTYVDYDIADWNDYLNVIGKVKTLEILSMSKDNIKTIDFLQGMDHLEQLHVEDNLIKDFSILSDLPSLKFAWVMNNAKSADPVDYMTIYND